MLLCELGAAQVTQILALKENMERNVRECIMPFWRDNLVDVQHGGFYGRVYEDLRPDRESPKSVVLNCRLLWAYTRAHEMLGDPVYRELAERAYHYICDRFCDPVYGGAYWMVTAKGEPSEVEKRTYGQAFLIFAMAAYFRAYGDFEALDIARRTLALLHTHAWQTGGGYVDSLTRDWLRDDWVNVWIKNRDGAALLLNSNMHLFEAILELAEATGDVVVMQALREQLVFLLEDMVDENLHHMKAGVDDEGQRIDHEINFGHDCECSYLMTRAAALLGEDSLIQKARQTAQDIVCHVLAEGLDQENGGLYYIADAVSGAINRSKIWWVQAEGITAFFNMFELTGQERFLDAAMSMWAYIETNMVNREMGEWDAVGRNPRSDVSLKNDEKALRKVFTNVERAGKGKCPYHNSRACFEIMQRVDALCGNNVQKNLGNAQNK